MVVLNGNMANAPLKEGIVYPPVDMRSFCHRSINDPEGALTTSYVLVSPKKNTGTSAAPDAIATFTKPYVYAGGVLEDMYMEEVCCMHMDDTGTGGGVTWLSGVL